MRRLSIAWHGSHCATLSFVMAASLRHPETDSVSCALACPGYHSGCGEDGCRHKPAEKSPACRINPMKQSRKVRKMVRPTIPAGESAHWLAVRVGVHHIQHDQPGCVRYRGVSCVCCPAARMRSRGPQHRTSRPCHPLRPFRRYGPPARDQEERLLRGFVGRSNGRSNTCSARRRRALGNANRIRL
jgi:hypothetical protein